MNLEQAFSELDGTDGGAVLTKYALGELLTASRDFAGVFDSTIDAQIATLQASSADAVGADLAAVVSSLSPYMAPLVAQLHGRYEHWQANPTAPALVDQAKVLFGVVRTMFPGCSVTSVLIDGTPIVTGTNIPVGGQLTASGCFPLTGMFFLRFRRKANRKDYWDMKPGSTTGRSVSFGVVPEIGVGEAVDVLVREGVINETSSGTTVSRGSESSSIEIVVGDGIIVQGA